MNIRKSAWAVLLTCLLVATAATLAFSQAQETNLVNVNLSSTTIKNDIAKSINVDVSQVPETVRAPIDVAAAVCGMSVDALTSQLQKGNNTCMAKSTNTALNQIVQKQIKSPK